MTQANALAIGELLEDCTVKLISVVGNVTKTGTACGEVYGLESQLHGSSYADAAAPGLLMARSYSHPRPSPDVADQREWRSHQMKSQLASRRLAGIDLTATGFPHPEIEHRWRMWPARCSHPRADGLISNCLEGWPSTGFAPLAQRRSFRPVASPKLQSAREQI